MRLKDLNKEIIDCMSADDMRATLREIYAANFREQALAAEEAKQEAAERAAGAAALDNFFADKFASQGLNIKH